MMVSVVANSVQAWEKIGTGIIRETFRLGARRNGYQQDYSDGSNTLNTIVQDIFQSIVLHTATVMLTEKLGIIKTQQPDQNEQSRSSQSSSSQFRPFRFNIDVSVY
jgi:uncharacterized protein YoxC